MLTAPKHSIRRAVLSKRDAGSVAVELAVLAPIALVLLVTVLQAGLWWHTRTLCHAAAQQAVQVARTVTGAPADAHEAALRFLTRGGGLVGDPEVTAVVDTRHVRVRVEATAPQVLPIPGLGRVVQEAAASKERFTVPGDSP